MLNVYTPTQWEENILFACCQYFGWLIFSTTIFFSSRGKECHKTFCIDYALFFHNGNYCTCIPNLRKYTKILKNGFKYLTLDLAVQSLFKAKPVMSLTSFVHVAYPPNFSSSEIDVPAVEILFSNILAVESDKIALIQSRRSRERWKGKKTNKNKQQQKTASEAEKALKTCKQFRENRTGIPLPRMGLVNSEFRSHICNVK